METTSVIPAEQKQPLVWNNFQVTLASALSGWICGFYLISKNYTNLGFPQLAKKTIAAGVVTNVILIIALLFVPENLIERIGPFMTMAMVFSAVSYVGNEHYKIVYNWNQTRQTLITVAIFVPLVLGLPFYLPEEALNFINKMPGTTYAIGFAAAVGYCAEIQKKFTKDFQKEVKKPGFLKLFGITIVSMIFLLMLNFLTAVIHTLIHS